MQSDRSIAHKIAERASASSVAACELHDSLVAVACMVRLISEHNVLASVANWLNPYSSCLRWLSQLRVLRSKG